MSKERLVGIVGLGSIGSAIAQHALAAGHPMIGWARRPESLEEFVRLGGRETKLLSGLGAADMVISVVFDDQALREVAFGAAGLIGAMKPGAIHIAMETISPRLARELYDAHKTCGQQFLSAPVFGRPEAAQRGDLAIMCSGDESSFESVKPILQTSGKARWVGSQPEHAMLLKLGGNHMILTIGELLAETFTFLRTGGVDLEIAKETLTDELMPRLFVSYARRLVADPCAERPAESRIGRKDNAVLLESAESFGLNLAIAKCIATPGHPS